MNSAPWRVLSFVAMLVSIGFARFFLRGPFLFASRTQQFRWNVGAAISALLAVFLGVLALMLRV